MEYVYATLLLDETNSELNETNLTQVLDAAGADVVESRIKALVASLEGYDVGDIDPAAMAGGQTEATGEEAAGDDERADEAVGEMDVIVEGGDHDEATESTGDETGTASESADEEE